MEGVEGMGRYENFSEVTFEGISFSFWAIWQGFVCATE